MATEENGDIDIMSGHSPIGGCTTTYSSVLRGPRMKQV